MLKRISLAFLVVGGAAVANAQTISANGLMTYTQNGPNYTYSITLNNTGTASLDAMWYSWIPGYDFMTVLPTNIVAPSGWSVIATRDPNPFLGSGDGYSIEFAGTALAGGNSLSGFQFTSTETPAQLAATSPIFPVATGETYVYTGAAQLSTFSTFVMTPTPEPATWLVLAPALLLLRRRKRV